MYMVNSYCTGSSVQERLMISSWDTDKNTKIQSAIEEASAFMDSYAVTHGLTIDTGATALLIHACADLTAAIFTRRFLRNDFATKKQMPGFGAGSTEHDYSGYWSLGLAKLDQWVLQFNRPGASIYFIESSGSGYGYVSGASGSNAN